MLTGSDLSKDRMTDYCILFYFLVRFYVLWCVALCFFFRVVISVP